jgi:hypothetical protein
MDLQSQSAISSRTAKLDDAIALVGDLEAGQRPKGKAVIVMT